MSATEPKKLGKYELLGLLGAGGMAEIYLARQTGIGRFERLVVLKKLLPGLTRNPKFRELFLEEARIAMLFNHPNVVRTYDLDHDGEIYFMVMEYLEGDNLANIIREGRQKGDEMPEDIAASVIAQVLDGLEYTHNLHDSLGTPLQIVHRDVSPYNIHLLFAGSVKLVDFGIAQSIKSPRQEQNGTLKGRPAYMSPEQCAHQEVDARSDVYSVGVVLWELLTRRQLFKRTTDPQIVRAVMNGDLPKAEDVRPRIAKSLSAIVDQALQLDPAERFKTAGAMAEALRDHLKRSASADDVVQIAAYVKKICGTHPRRRVQLLSQANAEEAEELLIDDPTQKISIREIVQVVAEKSSPGKGYLRLGTIPRAEIFRDGNKLGMTPIVGLELPAGTYQLEAISRDFQLRQTFEVTIEANQTTTMRLNLTEKDEPK